mgnify:CR=1 FL=1
MKRFPRKASRLSVIVCAVAIGSVSTRLLLGCGETASPSTFPPEQPDSGDPFDGTAPPLPDSSTPPPEPSGPIPLNAGPPEVPPVCDPAVAREGCDPPESVFDVPATVTVSRTADGGCRQMIHAETRDGGAFACVIGSKTECYGPLELGTKYPFSLGYGSSGNVVTGTFTVRFAGDGGPETVAIGGCFDP